MGGPSGRASATDGGSVGEAVIQPPSATPIAVQHTAVFTVTVGGVRGLMSPLSRSDVNPRDDGSSHAVGAPASLWSGAAGGNRRAPDRATKRPSLRRPRPPRD